MLFVTAVVAAIVVAGLVIGLALSVHKAPAPAAKPAPAATEVSVAAPTPVGAPKPASAIKAEIDSFYLPDATHEVKLGMTEDQVVGVIGQGEHEKRGAFDILRYPSLGVELAFRDQRAIRLTADASFSGQTSAGIKSGSKSAEIVAAYGVPDYDAMNLVYRSMLYVKANVSFELSNNRVRRIHISQITLPEPVIRKPLVSPKPLTLIPLQGAAELKFGSSLEAAKSLLGEPDDSRGHTEWDFYSHGLRLRFEGDRLIEIIAFTVDPESYACPNECHGFAGQLEDGLRMGADESEFLSKHRSDPGRQEERSERRGFRLDTQAMPGMVLYFVDNKLSEICIEPPAEAKAASGAKVK
jgi:hypothetical protein